MEVEKRILGQDGRPYWISNVWFCGRLWQACIIPLYVSFESARAELLNDVFSSQSDRENLVL